jgi:hypothetical protein
LPLFNVGHTVVGLRERRTLSPPGGNFVIGCVRRKRMLIVQGCYEPKCMVLCKSSLEWLYVLSA